ncbi:MAG: phosphotransferase family protein [Sphingobacteriales bacterium]|nr:phosphotransferase family protein [Sphingobacteriales bacterium]
MNEQLIDKAKPVREKEQLPLDKVDAWIKNNIPSVTGTPEITQYTGGASNWTYRIKYDSHDLILRRPPAGTKAASAHDMKREYDIQKALMPYYTVPEMLAFCSDHSVMDCDFYIMRRVEGIIPRANLPKELNLEKELVRQLCLNVIDKLIELHKIDINSSGLDKFGKGKGYSERQINGWSERYNKAKTWNVPKFAKVMKWLKANIPEEEGICLIHNDFRFDNVILDAENPMKIIGVLDWEMATIGDPMMDLGNTLAYWVQADDDFMAKSTRRQPTNAEGMLTRKEVIRYYCDKMGFEPKQFTFYEVYGLFRLAVIAQQIYYRYYHKQTRNKEFKKFWILIHYLNWRCKKAINQSIS